MAGLLEEHRKCKKCNKHKPENDYFAGHVVCKVCSNDIRAMRRMMRTQKCEEDIDKLKESQPKEYDAVVKAFLRSRESARKTENKTKFAFMSFIRTFRASTGTRREEDGEMMWEGEYIQWAKTAKAGFLSQAEAEAKWKKMVDDPDWPSDNDGPRGFKRVLVNTVTRVTHYDDVSKTQELKQEQKLGKNMSEEQLNAKLQQVMSMTDGEEGDVDFEALRQKASRAFGSAGLSALDQSEEEQFKTAFANGGVMAPALSDLAEKAKRKKLPAPDEEEEEEPNADEDDEVEAKKKPKGDPKWRSA